MIGELNAPQMVSRVMARAASVEATRTASGWVNE